MRFRRGLWIALATITTAFTYSVFEALSSQNLEQYSKTATGGYVVPVLRFFGDVLKRLASTVNEVINLGKADFFITLCLFLTLFGLCIFLWDNVLIRIFNPKLISREQKLTDEKKALDLEVLKIKESYDSREEEFTKEKITLLTNLKSSDADADKAYKKLEQSKEKLKDYESTTEPTYLRLRIDNGEWTKVESNNLTYEIHSIKEDSHGVEPVFVDVPTINPLTNKPLSKEFAPLNKDQDFLTYIITVSFRKPLTKVSNHHLFRERLENGTLDEPMQLTTTTAVSNQHANILYTITRASGEFHLKYQ